MTEAYSPSQTLYFNQNKTADNAEHTHIQNSSFLCFTTVSTAKVLSNVIWQNDNINGEMRKMWEKAVSLA